MEKYMNRIADRFRRMKPEDSNSMAGYKAVAWAELDVSELRVILIRRLSGQLYRRRYASSRFHEEDV
jgi:hypothetical protein